MKKRYLIIGLTVMALSLALTGCGGNSQTLAEYAAKTEEKDNGNASQGAEPSVIGNVTETPDVPDTEPENVSVVIYRPDSDATGFECQEALIPDFRPEYFIEELAKVDVVPYDTRVLDFSVSDDKKHLTIDLSAEYSSYINMMGTTGEYLVVGSLVNTFLEAYDAEDILIKVEGEALETSHALYDKPLLKYETELSQKPNSEKDKKKPMAYRLLDTSYRQEEKEIYYPQFEGMPDEELQKTWNQAILDIALHDYMQANSTVYDSYSVDYKIGYSSEEKISFLFTKKTKTGDKTAKELYALTFDLVLGKCIRFSDLTAAMETVSYNMANNGYYKIVNSDLDRETYDEHFKSIALDAGKYREMFLRYDYDFSDLSVKPEGCIYINADGELEIFMNPVKGLSDEQIEVQTGVDVK